MEVDGDAEIQQAVRFALFHVLQSAARAEGRAIAAKGLTGPGYHGHTFWHGDVCASGADLHRAAGGRPTCCDGGTIPCPKRGSGLACLGWLDRYPLMLHFSYFDLYRKQVVKQADLVLALHLRGDAFSSEQKARDFAYYEALTVRDSSLSACTRRWWRRRWATSSSPTTTSVRPR